VGLLPLGVATVVTPGGGTPRAVVIAVSAAWLCGCAGAPGRVGTSAGGQPVASARGGDLRALTAHLPKGADVCAGARPQTIADDRRAEFALVSRLPNAVWDPALGIDAVVRAERHRRGGRRGQVMVLRSRLSGGALARALEASLGLDLRWTDAPRTCTPDSCPSHARMVDDHIVAITGGEWLAPPDAVGVEGECGALAQDAPDALEWSVGRGQSMALAGGPMMPMRTSRVVRAGARALTVEQRDRMITPELAAEVASVGGAAAAGREVARRQDGDEVVTVSEFLFEDLRLRIDDAARLRAADRDADRILRLPPDIDVDVTRVGEVHTQIAYRLSLMEDSDEAGRASLRAGLVALLRRAVEQHPAEMPLVRMLVEMLLTDPHAAAEAAQLAAGFIDDRDHGADFRTLRKHALARSDLSALADALVVERVARRTAATGAARDIAALLEGGHSYAEAEAAWALSAGIARRARRVPIRAVAEVVLPLSSLMDGLLALRHLGAATGPLRLLVQHDGGLHALVAERSPRVMQGRALLSLDPGAGSHARSLGSALASAGLSGPLELTMPTRERGGRVLRLRGEVRGADFVLQAADAGSAGVDWARLRERMFVPLATLARGEFTLSAASGREAGRMIRLASGAFGVACMRQGDAVRCRARGAFADRGRAALLALVAKELSRDAERLWEP